MLINNEGVGLIYLGFPFASGRMAAPLQDSLSATTPASVVKIYPNPAVNNLSLQLEGLDVQSNTSLQLLNVNGAVEKTVQLGKIEKGHQSIDVSTLLPGTYFLIINNGGKIIREKVIKQ